MYCKPTLFIKSIKIISLLTLEVNDPRDSTTFSYFIINKSKIAMCGTIVQLSTTLMMDEAEFVATQCVKIPQKVPCPPWHNFLRDISSDFQTPWSTFEVEYHQFTFRANLTNVFPLSGKRRQLITTAASDISKSRRKGGTKKGPPMVERTRSSSRRLLIMQ